MAKFLDQNGSKRLVDNLKTSRTALNTKINSEIVARENLATDVTSSIAALDTKFDDRIQTIAVDGSTLSVTNGAGTVDTYQLQGTNDLASTTKAGLMSSSDKTKLDGLNSYTAGDNITISGGTIKAADTTYNVATASTNGLMSSSDKKKLDGIDAGAQVNLIEEFWVDGVKQTITNKKVSLDLSGKVDKVSGKQLSTEDFTTAEKTKLAGIENGAEANVIGSIKVDGTALTVTNKAVNINLSGKVDTVSGKQLSTNDFTTAEKNKLAGIENNAQANAIEEIFIDGTKQTVTDKKASLDLSNYAKKSDVAGVYKYKGSVNTFSALPTTSETGDVYNVKTAGGTDVFGTSIKAGDNVAFNGTGWDVLSGTVDLSGYVEKVSGKQLSTEDFTTALKNKLDSLASITSAGDNITISGGKISAKDTTYSVATSSANGLMSSSDKKKLDNLASITTAGANITISGGTIKAADTTYNVATTSTNGLMSSTDKAKLDGLSTYTAGDNITISGGKISGTANTTYSAGANITINGTTISGTANTTYSAATTTTSGLMSADDKKKLNNLASITSAGNNITISGGKISGTAPYTLPAATASTLGGVKIGSGISVSSGTISVPNATTSQAGIVKVGKGLSMNGDTLNVTVSGVDDLDTWNAANLYLKPAVLGSTSSTVNGAIWFVSDSGTSSGSSNVVVFGTTASTLDGAVWFA